MPRRRSWPHLASLQYGEAAAREALPKTTDSCPSPCGAAWWAHRQLCASCTWQHVIKAGAGFGVAQQRLWSEDDQLEWRRGRARRSALPETPPLSALPCPSCLSKGAAARSLLLTQLQCSARLGIYSRQHQPIPVGMSHGEEAEGLPGTCLSHGWNWLR